MFVACLSPRAPSPPLGLLPAGLWCWAFAWKGQRAPRSSLLLAALLASKGQARLTPALFGAPVGPPRWPVRPSLVSTHFPPVRAPRAIFQRGGVSVQLALSAAVPPLPFFRA
ncbi:unnamed protein product [Prorocentrum cordatum]|uniref:Secreted protein n=1 Tax=Prorocentrum cordatum TaxID=2364126 RepID=A0ABN9QJH1_9DINO|nr:unnamed protein product [Polarella glacialis]